MTNSTDQYEKDLLSYYTSVRILTRVFVKRRKVKKMGKKREAIMKEVTSMRSLVIGILLAGIAWVGASSCATVPKEPLASGEVRLLDMEALGAGIEANSSFAVNIFFEAAGNPEIKRACFYESGEEPSCFEVPDASYVTLGTKKAFQVYLPGLNVGSHRVECYAEYVRAGERRKTNVVFTQIFAATQQ